MSKYAPRILKDVPELNNRQVSEVIASYHEALKEDLLNHDRAYIHGVCTMSVKPALKRIINLPHMRGQESKATAKLRVKCSKALNDQIQELYADPTTTTSE